MKTQRRLFTVKESDPFLSVEDWLLTVEDRLLNFEDRLLNLKNLLLTLKECQKAFEKVSPFRSPKNMLAAR